LHREFLITLYIKFHAQLLFTISSYNYVVCQYFAKFMLVISIVLNGASLVETKIKRIPRMLYYHAIYNVVQI